MQLALSDLRQSILQVDYRALGIPALVLLIIAMLILPLPTLLLDILFTFNIMASLIVIMIAIHTQKPLDFSSLIAHLGICCGGFPSPRISPFLHFGVGIHCWIFPVSP